MANTPKISIVIPTLNCRVPLQRLLDSVDRQSFRDFEVLVVDNFSTDGTYELAVKRAQAFQKGPERHAQRTFGASVARGEYLMFFDSDMELDTGLLENCMDLARQGVEAAIIPERGGGDGFWAACQKLEKECYWNDPWMEAANRFIKKSIYEQVGGYRTDLIAGEDFELHDRLAAAGVKIGRATSMLTHYEDARFFKVMGKKYYYASKMHDLLREAPLNQARRFVLLKPAYIRNWKLFLKHPVWGMGLIVMKTAQFLAGGWGLVVGACRHRSG